MCVWNPCCCRRHCFACIIAVACVLAVSSIFAVAGVLLVPDVFTIAGLPAFGEVPGVVGILLLLGFLVLLGFQLLLPSLPILASLCYCSWYLYILYCTMRQGLSDYRTTSIGNGYQTVTFLLTDYRNIEYRNGKFEKLSDYQISDQGLNLSYYRISAHKNLSVAQLCQIFLQMEKVPPPLYLEWASAVAVYGKCSVSMASTIIQVYYSVQQQMS